MVFIFRRLSFPNLLEVIPSHYMALDIYTVFYNLFII